MGEPDWTEQNIWNGSWLFPINSRYITIYTWGDDIQEMAWASFYTLNTELTDTPPEQQTLLFSLSDSHALDKVSAIEIYAQHLTENGHCLLTDRAIKWIGQNGCTLMLISLENCLRSSYILANPSYQQNYLAHTESFLRIRLTASGIETFPYPNPRPVW